MPGIVPDGGSVSPLLADMDADGYNLTDLGLLDFDAATELTVATGAITIVQSVHRVDGEGDASDDLVTISGGTSNALLLLYPENAARNITLKHGSGNIVTPTGGDYTIPDDGAVMLLYDGTNWRVIFTPTGAGTGDVTAASAFATDESILRADGTGKGAQATSTNATLSDAGVMTLAGLNVGADTEVSALIGRTAVGHFSSSSDYASVSHYDRRASATGFALIQNSAGQTLLNAEVGQLLYLMVNNVAVASVASSAFTLMQRLSCVAGTTAIASLVIPPGTNLTSPVSGALENDGTNLYYTDSTPTRQTVAMVSGRTMASLSPASWISDTTNGADRGSLATYFRDYLSYDDSTVETCYSQPFRWTGSGTVTCKIAYMMASATSGKVAFGVSVEAVTSADALDLDANNSFDTANDGNETVPGTAGHLSVLSITLTNKDSAAAGDYARLKLVRNATDGTNDTATGDARVLAVWVVES